MRPFMASRQLTEEALMLIFELGGWVILSCIENFLSAHTASFKRVFEAELLELPAWHPGRTARGERV